MTPNGLVEITSIQIQWWGKSHGWFVFYNWTRYTLFCRPFNLFSDAEKAAQEVYPGVSIRRVNNYTPYPPNSIVKTAKEIFYGVHLA
jgi:hypothetical protein